LCALVNSEPELYLPGSHLSRAVTVTIARAAARQDRTYSVPSPEQSHATLAASGGGIGGSCFRRRTIAPSRPGGSRIAIMVWAKHASDSGALGSMAMGNICWVPFFSPDSGPPLEKKMVTLD
jgi:hypothetical protein